MEGKSIVQISYFPILNETFCLTRRVKWSINLDLCNAKILSFFASWQLSLLVKYLHFLRVKLSVIVKANIIIIKNKIRKTQKITFAIPALAAAIPVNPRSPAIIEMIKNNNASFNILSPHVIKYIYTLILLNKTSAIHMH